MYTCRYRLRLYNTLKDTFEMENYLKYNNKKVRVAFTKFCISEHNLRIERGRRNKKGLQHQSMIPREERLCERCDLNEIDDEWHLFRCPSHSNLRAQYNIPTFDNGNDMSIAELIHSAKPSVMWYIFKSLAQAEEMRQIKEREDSSQAS